MSLEIKKEIKIVKLYTDGACSGNPGPGGWAALLIYGDNEKMLSGHEEHTTNNRMELQAAIEGLKELKFGCQVILSTDSEYVKKGMTEWIENWKKRNWKNKNNEPVKNQDLWQKLELEVSKHQVSWEWVKGHSGHPENDRVDEAARLQSKKNRQ
jgi:ribonuclease HI